MSRRNPNIQWPWETEGWATEEYRARRDEALDDVVRSALKGAPSFYGVRQHHASVNPYTNLLILPIMGPFCWFLATKLGHEWWGWLVVAFFGLLAGTIFVASARMIPGWHRARAAAREYTQARGIPFPRELRWYR